MESQLILYPEFDARIERDYLYTVRVTQGTRAETIPVYNHTEDSCVNRNPVDGKCADEFRRFSSFAFAGDGVRVDIRVNRDFTDYAVIPARKRFRHSFHDGVISVFLDRPDYFVIRLDGKDHTNLAILADAPETEIPTEDENTIVINGWQEYEGGVLSLTKPHTTLYIPAGSVLNARVHVLADDCRILGRGAIVDPVGDIYRYNAAEMRNTGNKVLWIKASRTVVDGIHMLDGKGYNIVVIGTWPDGWVHDNRIRNVKILSTQMSSDGISFGYNTRESLAEHCFVYCGDNVIVYEDYAHYRDITVGTTCNALYPQTDVRNSTVEDVYVFRADEGIINATMSGDDNLTRLENHTIRNLSAVDITYTPYFLFVEIPKASPVVTTGDGLTVENVWLRALPETLTKNFYSTIAAGDYKIVMKNVAVNGKKVGEVTPETVGGGVNPAGQSFRYLTDGNFDPAVVYAPEKVNYKNPINVFVGHEQVFFDEPVLLEGADILLPAQAMQTELRTVRMAKCVRRNGTDYLRAADLVSSGMAKAVTLAENKLTVTPNDNTGNLLLPDSGIISKFTERVCYDSHMVVLRENGETIYRVINTANNPSVGIFRIVAGEVRKYGVGTYRLSFEVRSDEQKQIRAMIDYSNGPAAEALFDMQPDWHTCELDVTVTEADLDETKIAVIICGNGKCAIDVFDAKNISFRKIK